jgi:dolichyl-phosphate-mannose--protein O-mannosyl transferase
MKVQRSVGWCAVFALWVLGALLLLKIWNYQESLPDPIGSYIQFTVMFLATFYFLALVPIKRCVYWFFCRCRLFEEPNRGLQ